MYILCNIKHSFICHKMLLQVNEESTLIDDSKTDSLAQDEKHKKVIFCLTIMGYRTVIIFMRIQYFRH